MTSYCGPFGSDFVRSRKMMTAHVSRRVVEESEGKAKSTTVKFIE